MKKSILLSVVICVFVFWGCSEKLTPDQKAVKEVLSNYTGALKKGDLVTAYKYIAQVSKEHIPLAEFTNTWTKNLTEFGIKKFSIENIAIVEIHSKKHATAIVKRGCISYRQNKKYNQRLAYHLCEEGNSWQILRTIEIDRKIQHFLNSGETTKAMELTKVCIKIDPLKATSVKQYLSQLESSRTRIPTITPIERTEKVPEIKNAVLEVKRLKVYQSQYSSTTYIDIRVTNKSDKFISYWSVEADIFDAKGEYLGHAFTNGNNLRAGQSATSEIIYSNTRVSEVASWKPSIGSITLDLGSGERFDAERYFRLKEVK